MIGKLTGTVTPLYDETLLIDVQGVGYVVACSSRTRDVALAAQGVAVVLWIETVWRQDALHLYGFAHPAEQVCFRALTSVQGVGARVALAVLGVLSPDALLHGLFMENSLVIKTANGVGPKMAERIVSELKSRVGKIRALCDAATQGLTAITAATARETLGHQETLGHVEKTQGKTQGHAQAYGNTVGHGGVGVSDNRGLWLHDLFDKADGYGSSSAGVSGPIPFKTTVSHMPESVSGSTPASVSALTQTSTTPSDLASAQNTTTTHPTFVGAPLQRDALSALVNLGYSAGVAEQAVRRTIRMLGSAESSNHVPPLAPLTLENVVRLALKHLCPSSPTKE